MKKILTIMTVMPTICWAGPIPISMPIVINGNRGGVDGNADIFISLYLVLTVFIIIGATIRYFIIKNDTIFNAQSKIKNFLCVINTYGDSGWDLNIWSIFFIIIQVVAVILTTTIFVCDLLQ